MPTLKDLLGELADDGLTPVERERLRETVKRIVAALDARPKERPDAADRPKLVGT